MFVWATESHLSHMLIKNINKTVIDPMEKEHMNFI